MNIVKSFKGTFELIILKNTDRFINIKFEKIFIQPAGLDAVKIFIS